MQISKVTVAAGRRLIAALALTAALVTGLTVVGTPAPALAKSAPSMYVEQQCVIPSADGHRCLLEGVAHWVDASHRDPQPPPEWVRNAIFNCAIGALTGVAEVYMAGPQTMAIFMGVNCVEHVVADAIVTGGK